MKRPAHPAPGTAARGHAIALLAAASWCWLALDAGPARAQMDADFDRGVAADLYIRKRPSIPESPRLPPEMEAMLQAREQERNAKRQEAIGLLRGFLDGNPRGEARAEALFKLAELLWEEARRTYVDRMDRYERALEACRREPKGCKNKPQEPRIELAEPDALYRQILAEHPDFRRTDLVLYLVGFAAYENKRADESLALFQQVIARFPESPLYGDAWMMIGEHHFSASRWSQARDAFSNILVRPDAPTYDLALFKTAWCDWKLGDPDLAARRFKRVLDLAVEAELGGSSRARRRRAQLRDEALEYLVVVFTEDRSISAREVYDFLASIGGERYSRDVLVRVADAYYGQSEYERSVNTYRFLIDMSPQGLEAAAYQRRIVEAYVSALDTDQAIAEIQVLVDGYGPDSAWAEANARYPTRLSRSLRLTEEMARTTATNYHAQAQQEEKRTRKPDLALYTRAATAYEHYLSRYAAHERGPEVRFLRAEILYFKLARHEDAGDEYLAVGKTQPVGKYHKDALLKAMEAYEKARPAAPAPGPGGKRALSAADRKHAEAVDLYATLFPADPELVGVIFRNGQMFYDHGDYDEAIKRFGLIVTRYPDDANAGPAGDRILDALVKAEDYENTEEWARKLKKAKAFQGADQQARLDRIVVESIGKSGEKYAAQGEHEKAAAFYLRIPDEFPEHPLAPQAYMNAGVVYEQAKQPDRAAATYLALASRHPRSKQAPRAAFTAAQVYESVAYFDRAADAYEVVIKEFPNSPHGADALFNAGVLRQALGENERAIAHYNAYARRHRDRKDADQVAFRIGAVYESAGQHERAAGAFREYARIHRRDGAHVLQAHVRAGRNELAAGKLRDAAASFQAALKLYRPLRGKAQVAARPWAAEARYHEGELVHRDFQRIQLDVNPRKLRQTLDRKTALLDKAQGIYLDVVDFGDAQWATAALFRMGRIYEEFAESMRVAPVPPGLSEAEAQQYREQLELSVVEIEERAIELYGIGYQKALSLKIYNQYTRQIREALSKLDSGNFPPAVESRSRVRFGDRPLPPSVVSEVIRDE